MIKIFNGKSRGFGTKEEIMGMIMDFKFREILHLFPGAMLHVFIALALHSDENGLCYPSYSSLRKETGLAQASIASALNKLCELRNDGHRVLARFNTSENDRKTSNRYLIFPTEEEIEKIEGSSKIEQGLVQKLNMGSSKIELATSSKIELKVKPIEDKPLTETIHTARDSDPFDFLPSEEEPVPEEKQTLEASESPKGKVKKVPRQREMFQVAQALAQVTGMDFEKNQGRLFKEAKNYTFTDLRRIQREYGVGGIWYEWDWRGRGGSKPTLAHIRETWGNLRPPQAKPAVATTMRRMRQYVSPDGEVIEVPE